jgi:hypothetical protein
VSDQPDRFHAEGKRFLGETVIGRVQAVINPTSCYDRMSERRNSISGGF